MPLCDPSSHANPDQAHITHLSWDATINFDEQIILAKATYTVQLVGEDSIPPSVKFDTSHLDIHSVLVNNVPATFSMTVPDNSKLHLGSCLEVQLIDITTTATTAESSTIAITIVYNTTQQCTAAQWLPPAQTAGKQYPYIFTQCQAIHARSLLPCQDCPSVKMTYEARVTVPKWATCVMSALSKDTVDENENDDDVTNSNNKETTKTTRTFHFHQPTPIPSYLFALATGNITSRPISQRCHVWSEPEMVNAVEYEFAQVEQFLEAAEDYVGVKYVWGRYDILCLPPSFPYGGMENPCVSFQYII